FLRSNTFPHLALLHQRERIIDVLREHDGVLGYRLDRSVEYLVAGLQDVGPVVGRLHQRDEAALAGLQHALHGHFVHEKSRDPLRPLSGGRGHVGAARVQAHERIAPPVGIVGVAGALRRRRRGRRTLSTSGALCTSTLSTRRTLSTSTLST